ncbi:MAG: glycosyltransferase family 1 protein [Chloroflexi bacterium]|nr:MAG: glycosyltransferase family 1 protein [Chloroflexota bacterium]
MKIVCISASKVPTDAANSIQAMKAAHALAKLGHEVTLIVPENPEAPAASKDWRSLSAFYGISTQFKIEWLISPSRRLFFLAAVRRAKSLKPDLLYAWPLPSAVLGLLHGLPTILEMHDLPTGHIGPFWFRYFRDLAGCKRITVITTALKKGLDERYGDAFRARDVILAPNGVELERFENLPKPPAARRLLALQDAPTVVCTGHLYSGRGVDLFIDLAKRMRGVHFLWAGGRPDDVANWKSRAGAIPNVTFTGFVVNDHLPLYQAAADVLMMPYGREIGISSGGGNSALVSSPMKMFEYLASGRAIIVSDLPVFHEVLNENNAVFCPPDKITAWQGALQALFDNPARRNELARQARADAQQYSWIERARRILDGFPA